MISEDDPGDEERSRDGGHVEPRLDDRSLFESVPIGLYRTTPDGRLLTANRRLVELLGFGSLEELCAVSMESLYDSGERRRGWLRQVLVGGEGFHAEELRLRRRDGAELWVRDVARAVRLPDGRVVIEGSVEDLTEQRRTRDALLESEARLRAIVEHSTNLFYSHTPDHVLTYVSPQCRHFLGVEPAEACRRWTDFVTDNPVNAAGFESTRRAIATGRPQPPFELELRRADGSRLWVEVREAPVVDSGETVAVVGALTDVSGRRRAEAELRASEERYRRVVEDQTEFVVRWTPDTTRTFANEAYCRYFGLRREEAEGTGFLQQVARPDREAVLAKIPRLSPEQPTLTDVRRMVRPDGELAWNEWTDTALFDGGGELVEVQSVGRDVTDRIRLEEQLRHAQKMEAIGRLAGGVAHDFNNLLQVLLGSVQLLAARPALDDGLRAELDEMGEVVVRGAQLARQLLLFARREAPSRRRVDLGELVAGSRRLLRHLLRENVELDVAREPDPLPVDADAAQLEQVLVNLAANASDAMPAGGRLRIRTFRRGDRAVLEVADTGQGVAEEIRSRLFEPFFTTKERGKGTGLGLAVVDGIVGQHDGEVEVESRLGEGSRFRVLLPLAAGAASVEAVADLREAAPVPMAGARVALVEDDPGVRATLAEVLGAAGLEVVGAGSVAEGLGIADRRVDLLLTDYMLPDGTGLELAHELWRSRPELPVVVVSGYAEAADVAAMVADGRVTFLAKPFSVVRLLDAVRTRLAGGSG